MLKFFISLLRGRRSLPPRARSAASASRSAKAGEAANAVKDAVARPPTRPKDTSAYSRPGFLDRLPVAEVKESHDESVWDEWEHSSMELDSRMGGLSAHDSVKVKNATPSQMGELDPFASVRKKKRP